MKNWTSIFRVSSVAYDSGFSDTSQSLKVASSPTSTKISSPRSPAREPRPVRSFRLFYVLSGFPWVGGIVWSGVFSDASVYLAVHKLLLIYALPSSSHFSVRKFIYELWKSLGLCGTWLLIRLGSLLPWNWSLLLEGEKYVGEPPCCSLSSTLKFVFVPKTKRLRSTSSREVVWFSY